MPKIYATRDYEQTGPDFGHIRENAEILTFTSREDAEEWLRVGYSHDNHVIIESSTAWGEAWIKSVRPPHADSPWITPFALDELFIQEPGDHPGGRFYWITPCADIPILVAIVSPENDGLDVA